MLIFDQLKKNDAQLRLLALLILVGLFILFAGLWWVQIAHGSKYQASLEEQSLWTVRLPAVRGKIFDRNGIALADNRPCYNVNLYLEQLSKSFRKEYDTIRPRKVVTNDLPFWKDWLGYGTVVTQKPYLKPEKSIPLERTARYRVASGIVTKVGDAMRTPLTLGFTNFTRHFDTRRVMPYMIASNLTPAQLACFKEQSSSLPAVDLEVQSQRYYPFGNTAAHVLGYVGWRNESVVDEQSYYDDRLPDFKGLIGIEGNHDKDLRGAAGQKTVVVNNLRFRQTETVVIPVESGKNVHLTLDLKIQQAAEKALQTQIGFGGKGAVVVMNVWSGDVLALVSLPSMDPNVWVRHPTREEKARWDNAEAGLQKNRATREIYQAGSIFKTIVALAALETPEARFDPKAKYHVEPNKRDPAHGAILVGKQLFRDTVHPGDYDLERALAESSNSYFIALGLRHPKIFERVVELGRRLHLGERVGLPLMQEHGGHFPTIEQVRKRDWNDGDSANICIGQGGMAVTPMQMAVMTSALANGGKVLTPRLVTRIESQELATVEPPKVFPDRQVRSELGVSRRSLEILHGAMLAETEKSGGTGFNTFNPYYQSGGKMRVCGKTGTAELDVRGPDGRLKNTTWFTSFAPHERPKYAVVVMVENGHTGGSTCAPVAREVYMALEKLGQPQPGQTASTR